jgi:hypothetical protein
MLTILKGLKLPHQFPVLYRTKLLAVELELVQNEFYELGTRIFYILLTVHHVMILGK